MDKEFLVGCLCALVAFLSIVVGITVYNVVNLNDQIKYEQVCESEHKGVVFENVNDNLVSECK